MIKNVPSSWWIHDHGAQGKGWWYMCCQQYPCIWGTPGWQTCPWLLVGIQGIWCAGLSSVGSYYISLQSLICPSVTESLGLHVTVMRETSADRAQTADHRPATRGKAAKNGREMHSERKRIHLQDSQENSAEGELAAGEWIGSLGQQAMTACCRTSCQTMRQRLLRAAKGC